MEETLEEFRNLWKTELQSKDSALSVYQNATQLESDNKISDAIVNYRRAIRLDPTVEERFRQYIMDKTTNSNTPQPPASNPIQIQQPQTRQVQCFLRMFPRDILKVILCFVVSNDLSLFSNMSLVSILFNETIHQQPVYKFLSLKIHNGYFKYEELKKYDNDWLNLLINKPKLRFNGVYISTFNYIRQGYSENFNQPLLMVTYFRYLRLYQDGTCQMFTTTTEPKAIVRTITKTRPAEKAMMDGVFTFDGSILNLKLVEVIGERTAEASLTVENTSRRRHYKLEWISYEMLSSFGTASDIPLHSLKYFVFSQVKKFS